MLELLVPDLDWELAEQIEQATGGPGLLRIQACPRRRWLRPRRPNLWMDDELDEETPVLDDQADFDEHEFTLHPAGREALARSLRTLDALLNPGWSFRAFWFGDPVERTVTLPARELAELARRSALVRTTLYRVSSDPAPRPEDDGLRGAQSPT